MPVIRVSDRTWERLQHRAVPFVDTPDDIVQKLLDLADGPLESPDPTSPTSAEPKRISRGTGGRLSRGIRLPMKEYFSPVLQAVYELGGKGRTSDVLAIVEGKLAHRLPEVDYEPLPSGSEIRWRNRANWARKRLVTKGLLRSDSERGVWELTEQGTKAIQGSEDQDHLIVS